MGLKLDIGCGQAKRPGFIGIDSENYGQEIVRTVERGLPFADNTVSEIYCSHMLEHIAPGEPVLFFLYEIWRVCHAGARVYFQLPNSTSPAACGPTHLSQWNRENITFFDRRMSPRSGVPERYPFDFRILEINENSQNHLRVWLSVQKEYPLVNPSTESVTIISVAYNQLSRTKRLVTSLRRWTNMHRVKLVIVNSGSTDGTKEWLDAQDDLIALHGENVGWVEGINKGLNFWSLGNNRKPISPYVIIANNDVEVTDQDWLTRLLGHFTQGVGAVGPTTNYAMGRQHRTFDHVSIYEEEAPFLIGFFLALSAEAVEAIEYKLIDIHSRIVENGSAKVSGADDLDLSLRLRGAGFKLVIARDVFVYHSGSASLKAALSDQDYKDLCKDATNALVEYYGDDRVLDMLTPPQKMLIGIPLRGDYVHRRFCFTFSMVVKPMSCEVCDVPKAHVATARNALVERALSEGFTHLLFLDDDHEIPPDTILRLLALDAEVACSLAYQRVRPYAPCIYRWAIDPETGLVGCLPLEPLIETGVQQIDATGFAAVLIQVGVFKKLKAPWFEWNEHGEDIDFSLKCHDNDIKIFCDTNLTIPHIGEEQMVKEKEFRDYQEWLKRK